MRGGRRKVAKNRRALIGRRALIDKARWSRGSSEIRPIRLIQYRMENAAKSLGVIRSQNAMLLLFFERREMREVGSRRH